VLGSSEAHVFCLLIIKLEIGVRPHHKPLLTIHKSNHHAQGVQGCRPLSSVCVYIYIDTHKTAAQITRCTAERASTLIENLNSWYSVCGFVFSPRSMLSR
jgi:hypothetical protein